MHKIETSELGGLSLPPLQIWLTLKPELRVQVIQFLAYLTSNLITTQTANPTLQAKKEVSKDAKSYDQF